MNKSRHLRTVVVDLSFVAYRTVNKEKWSIARKTRDIPFDGGSIPRKSMPTTCRG